MCFRAAWFAWLLVCVCLSVVGCGVVAGGALSQPATRRLEDESAPKPLLESEVDMVSILFFLLGLNFILHFISAYFAEAHVFAVVALICYLIRGRDNTNTKETFLPLSSYVTAFPYVILRWVR